MNLFSSPIPKNDDYYEVSRFKLSWKISRLLVISLLLASITFTIAQAKGDIFYSIGFLISSITFLWLKIKEQYKEVAYFLTISGILLVSSSVLFDRSALHIIDPLWFIAICVYSYFTIGKVYGNIMLGVSAFVMMFYALFLINGNLSNVGQYNTQQQVAMAFEFLICLFIVGYFVTHFLDSIAHSEKQVKQSNVDLMEQNKLISMSNNEKTVLLQEIHHRVKNNLQVIVSLLRIQASELSSEEAKVNFHEAINRIMSMSLIHQRMYEEKNLSAIVVKDYFETLIRDVIDSYDLDLEIELEVNSTIDKIGLKTMVPFGLMITELVTNSLKHAFPGERQGKISLLISEDREFHIKATYADDGTWKEPIAVSFGMELIDTLTNQLDGDYERSIDSAGTTYSFRLDNLDV